VNALIAGHHGDPLFTSINMRDMNDDSWFSDEVHAKPHIVPLWVRRIAAPLNAFVARVDERTNTHVDTHVDARINTAVPKS
jgi:hypothetical protein